MRGAIPATVAFGVILDFNCLVMGLSTKKNVIQSLSGMCHVSTFILVLRDLVEAI